MQFLRRATLLNPTGVGRTWIYLVRSLCLLLFCGTAVAQVVGDHENYIEFSGGMDSLGESYWKAISDRTFFETDRMAIKNKITVSEDADGVRANQGQLRFDYALSQNHTLITGLNFYSENRTSSFDVQSGLKFNVNGISGDFYSVIEQVGQQADAGGDKVWWRANYKTGGGLGYLFSVGVLGPVQTDARFDFNSANSFADLTLTLSSPTPLDGNADAEVDDMLDPFASKEDLLDGETRLSVEGSWAARLKAQTNGPFFFDGAFNSRQFDAGIGNLSLSALHMTSSDRYSLLLNNSQVGGSLELKLADAGYLHIHPILEYDWLSESFGHSLTSKFSTALTDNSFASVAAGYGAPKFAISTLFARADAYVLVDDSRLSIFVKGQRDFGADTQSFTAGAGLYIKPSYGAFQGTVLEIDAQVESSRQVDADSPKGYSQQQSATLGATVRLPF